MPQQREELERDLVFDANDAARRLKLFEVEVEALLAALLIGLAGTEGDIHPVAGIREEDTRFRARA